MITGYNTDVEFEGVTYHVQTEDKGSGAKMVVSLVYRAGSILASKRSSYEELMSDALATGDIEDRLKRQHKLMCAAVRAGRFDELRHLGHKDGEYLHAHHQKAEVQDTSHADAVHAVPNVSKPESNGSTPEQEFASDNLPEDAVEVLVPSEAVSVFPQIATAGKTLTERLQIRIVGAPAINGGDEKALDIKVCRGNDESGVGGVHLITKVAATAFSPLIYHSITDHDGLATVHLQVPHFNEGRATLVIRAKLLGEQTEYRQQIEYG